MGRAIAEFLLGFVFGIMVVLLIIRHSYRKILATSDTDLEDAFQDFC